MFLMFGGDCFWGCWFIYLLGWLVDWLIDGWMVGWLLADWTVVGRLLVDWLMDGWSLGVD